MPTRSCAFSLGTFAVSVLATLFLALAATAQTGPFVSQATVYGTGDGGACSYGTVVTGSIPFGRIVAVGGSAWNDGLGCGRFIEVDVSAGTCLGGVPCTLSTEPLVVQVVDRCPECLDNELDLSSIAWNELTGNATPTVITNVTWDWVPGAYPGNMRVDVRSGSSAFFLSVIPRDFNVGIQTLEVRSFGDSVWQAMPQEINQGFFTWNFTGAALVLPLSIRVTDQNGAVYEAVDAVTAFSGSHDLGLQPAPPLDVPLFVPLGSLGLVAACLIVAARRLRDGARPAVEPVAGAR